MNKKLFAQSLCIAVMLSMASGAGAGSNTDNTIASTVVSPGAFSQTFKVTTDADYHNNGSITVTGLSKLFGSLSLSLQSGVNNLFNVPLPSQTTGKTEKAVFKDIDYEWNLAPASTYTLMVSGTAKLDGVSYSIRGSQLQIAPVPEPETYTMLLAGLGVIGAIALRRSRQA